MNLVKVEDSNDWVLTGTGAAARWPPSQFWHCAVVLLSILAKCLGKTTKLSLATVGGSVI